MTAEGLQMCTCACTHALLSSMSLPLSLSSFHTCKHTHAHEGILCLGYSPNHVSLPFHVFCVLSLVDSTIIRLGPPLLTGSRLYLSLSKVNVAISTTVCMYPVHLYVSGGHRPRDRIPGQVLWMFRFWQVLPNYCLKVLCGLWAGDVAVWSLHLPRKSEPLWSIFTTIKKGRKKSKQNW